jgi:hypothetical protein
MTPAALEAFRRKYDAQAFDSSDSKDALAEEARRLMIRTASDAELHLKAPDGEHLQYMTGGLLLGLICFAAANMKQTDEAHASLRAGLIQMMPWAIDMMRSIDGRPPLADA